MAAVSFSGLDGIDLGAVIDATINAERTPLNILKQRQTYIQSRDSALSSFSSSISTMETQVPSLIAESTFDELAKDQATASTTTSIDITVGTSLLSLRNSMNAQNSGVVATVVNTGASKKLVIASRETCSGFTTTLPCASMKVQPGSNAGRLKRQSNC